MAVHRFQSDKRRLVIAVSLLLTVGFAATALSNYYISRGAIRETIAASALPLTSDNIYSEIQKDLLRPVLISSLMASDTFLHDWVHEGEKDIGSITRYLREIKERYGAFTSFFISERTRYYYQSGGILKKVAEEDGRDAWYFRVRRMSAPYELNVDPDAANKDAITIFINYRVHDRMGNYIGAAGIGLTVEAVRKLVESYQERYERNVYFVDKQGAIALIGRGHPLEGRNIRDVDGLKAIADDILAKGAGSFRYRSERREYLLNVRFIPELNWHLFVTQNVDDALQSIRRTLYVDLAISALITAIVLLLTTFTISRYQRRLEEMATTDKLTGLANRQAFGVLVPQAMREAARAGDPLLAILLDLDHFKTVNDRYGHAAGDRCLREVAKLLRECFASTGDALVARLGGEEFGVLVAGADVDGIHALAEAFRDRLAHAHIALPDGRHFDVTVSVGVARFAPGSHRDADALYQAADEALYRAKHAGRNRIESA